MVEIRAVSLNPVDLKVKSMVLPDDPPRQLGFDACGHVVAIGPDVTKFKPGDRVYHAGSAIRPGSNATHQLVDSRIVALAPATLDDGAAAALPLTALTAWEALFVRMHLSTKASAGPKTRLLIINGAGGVGSIALQLARIAGIEATATASRTETQDWCRSLGATEVVGHDALDRLADNSFDVIFCCHDTGAYFSQMTRLVAPQGTICAIVGMPQPQALMPLFQKSASFVWEYMFTRSTFQTFDMAHQGEILAEIARLVDAGEIVSTQNRTLHGLTPEVLSDAHVIMAEGKQVGKLVVTL